VASAASASTYGSRTLKSGMTGDDVTQLQKHLTTAGHRVPRDGEFGTKTIKALKKTEKELELKADSIATPRDQRAILRAVSTMSSGGAVYVAPPPIAKVVPGAKGKVNAQGYAIPPATAPPAIKAVIAAGNKIAMTPYVWGGGHGKWNDRGYDCSGSVSYALHAAGLVKSPLVSGDFAEWPTIGPGPWITIYANAGHVYMYVAGMRFDTSARGVGGSRWTSAKRSNEGFTAVHPRGF
jgi:cell wall-associated NlpC family hydrolase